MKHLENTTPSAAEQASPSRDKAARSTPSFIVRDSKIHGKGVFATRKIPADSLIVEYEGERISWKEAVKRENNKAADDFHTFFFSLESGKIIDGGSYGNDARWINHSCEPNCVAREEDGHVFIYALRDLKRGEELNYDYGLILEERHTPALKRAYACRCGAATCRHTLLAPKQKKKAKA